MVVADEHPCSDRETLTAAATATNGRRRDLIAPITEIGSFRRGSPMTSVMAAPFVLSGPEEFEASTDPSLGFPQTSLRVTRCAARPVVSQNSAEGRRPRRCTSRLVFEPPRAMLRSWQPRPPTTHEAAHGDSAGYEIALSLECPQRTNRSTRLKRPVVNPSQQVGLFTAIIPIRHSDKLEWIASERRRRRRTDRCGHAPTVMRQNTLTRQLN